MWKRVFSNGVVTGCGLDRICTQIAIRDRRQSDRAKNFPLLIDLFDRVISHHPARSSHYGDLTMPDREEVIATNKIIFAVVFVCAAIITSLFVFNITHRPTKSLVSASQGLVFPEPRDINRFELMTTDGKPFTQDNLRGHWTVLFFGFSHCASICPASLDVIKHAYTSLKQAHPDLQVVFISLDPDRDKPAILEKYVHSFNTDFIAVSGKTDTLRKLQSQFGVFSARDNASGNDYQLQHTASIFLINPKEKWAAMFNAGLTADELVTGMNASINA